MSVKLKATGEVLIYVAEGTVGENPAPFAKWYKRDGEQDHQAKLYYNDEVTR